MNPYRNWINSLAPSGVSEEIDIPLPGELEIQSLWYQGFIGNTFTTTEGAEVCIKYFGEWNHASGPDFLECIVTIDDIEHKGAIELDLSTQHWELHGHATNSAFDDVILHISFTEQTQATFCRNSKNENIPQVIVKPARIISALQKPAKTSVDTIPGFCANEFAQWDDKTIKQLIQSAAEHRIQVKAEKLAQKIEAIGLRETLWQAIASTLGYRPNQYSMQLLSQRLKAHTLLNLPDADTRISLCLGMAGFLSPKLHEKAPEDTKIYIQSLWEIWWKYRDRFELSAERQIHWTMHGQRPVNHPHRRIASLPLLLPALHSALDACKHPTPQRFQELKKTFTEIQDSFWSHHYTLTSGKSSKALKLFGADKFNELQINFLIPVWYLKDRTAAISYYKSLKTTTTNDQVRRALGRLFPHYQPQGELTQYSLQHQGLIQLYRDFCLNHGCLKCPFPKFSTYTKNSNG